MRDCLAAALRPRDASGSRVWDCAGLKLGGSCCCCGAAAGVVPIEGMLTMMFGEAEEGAAAACWEGRDSRSDTLRQLKCGRRSAQGCVSKQVAASV